MSSTDFYRAFEDRYRGPRELIRERLQVYQPFIVPLLSIYQPAQAIDLGCGRGEWLELLQDAGFTPKGVDLDVGMLAACTERGLPVVQGDALTYLQSLNDASQCIVSGFHIAEHLSFDDLVTVVVQAFRVLKPGGLLILETPNPENVVVGSNSFYLDPTHVRPIPPPLLSFLPEYYSFSRVHTLRLQESPALHQRNDISLIDVLGGVSPDYAVVAQKGADPEILARFESAFAARYGVTLGELASRFDESVQLRISILDRHLARAKKQVETQQRYMDELTAQAKTHTEMQLERIDELSTEVLDLRQQANALEFELSLMRKSLLWRIKSKLSTVFGCLYQYIRNLRV